MAYLPKTLDTIRVPERLWKDLRFCWPGRAHPTGFLGIGGISSVNASPQRYIVPGSNAPAGSVEHFTLAGLCTVSGAVVVGSGHLWSTLHVTSVGFGTYFDVSSGLVRFVASDGTSLFICQASFATNGGRTFSIAGMQTRSAMALYLDGTLATSAAQSCSWTAQTTLSLGWRGDALVWSGGVSDVCAFTRALEAWEVRLLDAGLRGVPY